ncbi:hypothetical protein [Streptomyces sp. NPDC087298]|uniref:hypothetical protein n=1 Tax=Streptomyces sp. NPDC087298 TaxID=3365779 RepID=UPI00381B0CA6
MGRCILRLHETAALVAWMITGFTRLPGRWLRWQMFCRATFTVISLTGTTKDGRTEPVNVYDHLSPGSFIRAMLKTCGSASGWHTKGAPSRMIL